MEVQSVVFPRTFSKDAMADFLHKEQLIPLKGIDRSQSNWWRVRITDPEKYKGYITKILPKSNIHLVIGYMNKPKKEDIMIGRGEKVYYGIRPLKKNERHPTIKEAFDNKQIKYFGLHKVPNIYETLPQMKKKDLLEINKINKMILQENKKEKKITLPKPIKSNLKLLSSKLPLTKKEIKELPKPMKLDLDLLSPKLPQTKKKEISDEPLYHILNTYLQEYNYVKKENLPFNKYLIDTSYNLRNMKLTNERDIKIRNMIENYLWNSGRLGYRKIMTLPIMSELNDLATYETEIRKTKEKYNEDKKKKYTTEINEELKHFTKLFTNLRNKLYRRLILIDN
jgi:hypothetical protein